MAKNNYISVFTFANCKVEVEGNAEYEQDKDELLISFDAAAKLKISVDKRRRYTTRRSHKEDLFNLRIKEGEGLPAECSFVCLNPKENNVRTKVLLQEVLKLYSKELPMMSYAANTGKVSPFVERCVTGGKYCSLLLKSDAIVGTEKVIAAITYQIIPPDTQYAEIPLAAVNKHYQHKGFGRLLYGEVKKRLHDIGVLSLFCWGDHESEGFWIDQGFSTLAEVDGKGKARKLPVKNDVRRAMSMQQTHVLNNIFFWDDGMGAPMIPSDFPVKVEDSRLDSTAEVVNTINTKHCDDSVQKFCKERGIFDFNAADTEETMLENSSDIQKVNRPYLPQRRGIKRSGPAEQFYLKSIDVTEDHRNDDISFTEDEYNVLRECENKGGSARALTASCIMREPLVEITEEMGGAVSSVGNICTHVVTGQVRRTLNFCTALCAGAWVVSPDWLKASCKENKFVDEMPFILEDKVFESKYGVTVEDVVFRGRANPHKLLDHFHVYLTPHVQPPVEALSDIVKSAGGKVLLSLERLQVPSHTFALTCGEDMSEALAAAMTGMPTFSSDWFMCCIMKQEFDFNAPQFTQSL